jgi:hypothetical protein
MNATLEQIKAKAIADFKASGTYYGAHTEEINGNSIQAYVAQQCKGSNRRYNAVVCNWYLNKKKTSLAKVLAVL